MVHRWLMASYKRLVGSFCVYRSKRSKLLLGILFALIASQLIIIFSLVNTRDRLKSAFKGNVQFLLRDKGNVHNLNQFSNKGSMKKVSLLVCVLSGPDNKNRRDTIRHTWARKTYASAVAVFFFIGIRNLPYGTYKTIFQEREKYKDIIFLPHYQDNYETLTLKVLNTFEWAFSNVIFDYLLKVDDDTYVRMDKFLRSLDTKPIERLYWGHFNTNSQIVKEGRWAETKTYICDEYVSYALGGGYVLSRDLVQYVAENSDRLNKFKNEDVSVGTWLAPLAINKVNDNNFRMSGDCEEHYILLHYASVEDMKTFHRSLSLNGTLCGATKKAKSVADASKLVKDTDKPDMNTSDTSNDTKVYTTSGDEMQKKYVSLSRMEVDIMAVTIHDIKANASD